VAYLPDSDKIQLLVAIAALATLIVFSVSIVVQSCQTRESLAKTDTSNAYTRRSLELAEQNYIIENRAWVGLEDFPQIVPTNTVVIMDAKSGKQRPEEIEIKFGIKNFGKTPADSIYIRDSCIIASTRKDFIFPQIPVDTYKGRWQCPQPSDLLCQSHNEKTVERCFRWPMPDCLFVGIISIQRPFTGNSRYNKFLPTKSNPIHLFQLEQIINEII